jgi:hypothetical protein
MGTKRARTERRERERAAVKVAEARRKLAALESGGAPDRPIEVTSASTVEIHATSMPCVGCEATSTQLEEHVATTVTVEGGERRPLRVAHVRCPRCGVRRKVYFRIGTTLLS